MVLKGSLITVEPRGVKALYGPDLGCGRLDCPVDGPISTDSEHVLKDQRSVVDALWESPNGAKGCGGRCHI